VNKEKALRTKFLLKTGCSACQCKL